MKCPYIALLFHSVQKQLVTKVLHFTYSCQVDAVLIAAFSCQRKPARSKENHSISCCLYSLDARNSEET